jgi:ribonuclease G
LTLISDVTKTILISVDLSELRVAVVEEGRTVEALIERRGEGSLAGNIYKGKIDNVLRGMEAAFVDLGLPRNGFLYVDDVVVPGQDPKTRRRRKIDELLKPGQEVLVQVVKDSMGTKGPRVTMELSIAGRFLVLSPHGEGSGVSRRLPDGERERLRKLAKSLEADQGGIIVRTAAAGATAEDLERDLRFLHKMWAQVEARAKPAKAGSLVYAEADLSLKVIRDLLARNVQEVWVDSERQYRRILGWVRTTQPEFVDRIKLYSDSVPLFERHGVDQAILSTLNKRVDLPSGGYLIFDYAEAFTVIDVNTGRFVGSSGRLEDTITRNNIEAAREVMRQLRLRDIGGIIVIDFIDMASAKNRAEVLKVLQAELENDRTKTYLVEISPLGLVEMTRQNVTAGVREILTRTCPTCGGEGVVLSEQTMAVEAERRLRRIARSSGADAFLVRLNAKVASGLVGPGGMKLLELERETGKHFTLEPVERMLLSEVDVVREGTRAEVDGDSVPFADGDERTVKISEPHMYNVTDGVARVDGGYPVVVGGAIGYVGQQHKVRIDRATRTTAYATLLDAKPTAIDLPPEPGDYELPEFDREVGDRLELEQRTRPRTRRKTAAKPAAGAKAKAATAEAEPAEAAADEKAAPKPRRRSRAKPAAESAAAETAAGEEPTAADVPAEPPADGEVADVVDAAAEGGDEAAANRRRRRGKRGGRGRSKAAAAANGDAAPQVQSDADPGAAPAPEEPATAAADDAAPAAPRPRRRAPARRPAASAAAAADAEPAPAPDTPAVAPAPAPAAASPPAEPAAPAAPAADGAAPQAERKRGLLGKILGG